MSHPVRRFTLWSALLGSLTLSLLTSVQAQYKRFNLVANQSGKALHVDSDLVNAWGLAFSSTGPFWLSDNGTGLSTLYSGPGVKQSLVVTIPSASGAGNGSPTGIVFNSSSDFVISSNGQSGAAVFLFATLDGTISGWSPSVDATNAIIAVNNSKSGAAYTGLAITTDNLNGTNYLFAADTVNNKVDIYDGNFNFVRSFTDPMAPAGFTPYGIQDIGNSVYVTYASITSGSGGLVDVYSESGDLMKRLIAGNPLNQPWGLAVSPGNFGPLSNALLVSNNTPSGTINAFDRHTGKFIGTIRDTKGKPITIDQLWGIAFGAGNSMNGNRNQLFFTAGPNEYVDGIFGAITLAPGTSGARKHK
ncbi:MAG TPA: TIGR03118 family protein [Terriglobales bacterium]|nr:TIGR03118 family protein [Terriglobales bacterium]